jgi:hypothetical protein
VNPIVRDGFAQLCENDHSEMLCSALCAYALRQFQSFPHVHIGSRVRMFQLEGKCSAGSVVEIESL